MLWIDWITINTNRSFESNPFDLCLAFVVTLSAETLQFSIPEFLLIVLMWLDVISNCCWDYEPVLQAEVTKGMVSQLSARCAHPPNTPVEVVARS
jgi:hypothetical protein